MDSPITLMHFSDVHFGVENYGKFDPSTGLSTRLLDFRNSLNSAIDSAISLGVEIALFTGDAYKTRDPSQTHQREFASCLNRLTKAGVPVVLITGNHDISNARGKANSVEIFSALAGERLLVLDKPGLYQATTSLGRTVQIACVPYLTKSAVLANDQLAETGVQDTVDAVVKRYEMAINNIAAKITLGPKLPTVFAGHFSVTTAKIGSLQRSYLLNEPEVSKSALARSEFDYVALGHIHKFQDLNAGHQPPIVYSGSIDRIDFGERNESKGYVLVKLAKGSSSYQFIESPSRPFIEIDVDATQSVDPTEAVLREIAKVDLDHAVVKLIYRVRVSDEHLLDERRIHAALSLAFIKIAVRKEVIGDQSLSRGIEHSESADTIEILCRFIEKRPELLKYKEQLCERAQWLIAQDNESLSNL